MYKADHGTFPVAMTSCLGDASAYGRGFGGSESTGGQIQLTLGQRRELTTC